MSAGITRLPDSLWMRVYRASAILRGQVFQSVTARLLRDRFYIEKEIFAFYEIHIYNAIVKKVVYFEIDPAIKR